MYKIIDIQGNGTFEDEVFATQKEVIDRLAQFHSSDFEGRRITGKPYSHIHEWLYEMKDDTERLNELLEWGTWDIEKLDELGILKHHVKELIQAIHDNMEWNAEKGHSVVTLQYINDELQTLKQDLLK